MVSQSASHIESKQIAAIREFNRFYTARLGLLRRRHLEGRFSLTEARMLYEIGTGSGVTASALRATLQLDAGYVSRLLAGLVRRRLIRQTASKRDAREKMLELTAAGDREVSWLNTQSAEQIRKMLGPLKAGERAALAQALNTVKSLLGRPRGTVRMVRLQQPRAAAFDLLEEYYEAINVVKRDDHAAIERMIADPASGMWLAYLNGKAMGCVVLRPLEGVPAAGECKRLYVRPEARGYGLAGSLMDALEACARRQGMRWVYLDSFEDLKAAVALYRKRGYRPCARYNDNPQATVFLRKRLG